MLRRVAAANGGMKVVFSPGVEGEISIELQNVPLQAAFNQLIGENSLDFAYDPATNTVTIFREVTPATRPAKKVTALIALQATSLGAVRRALENEEPVARIVTFDVATNTVSISGDPRWVDETRGLVKRLDQAAIARQRATAGIRRAAQPPSREEPASEPVTLGEPAAEATKREPSRMEPPEVGEPTAAACIDQTWVYKLAGIGAINDRLVANIDGADYGVGDSFASFTITDVQSDRAILSKRSDSGAECHVVRFRR